MPELVHNCKSAPCPVCGSPDGSGLPLQMPFDTFDIEVTLTWSSQDASGDVGYLGDQGEETRKLTDYALLEILRSGLSDGEGSVVTSITIWPPIPARQARP